ncbi:MAG: HDIG domain-containing protein [Syntrophales bacterium]|nr:HDIG domain-containing protein [Syntrophales bacterium]MDD5640468.1 HDIG domain-containing protein [Syntrophales bacterium]
MPEKEPQEKIRRIFGLGRLSSMLPRSLSRKSLSVSRHERLLKILLLLGLSLAVTLTLTPRGQRPLRQYKVGDIAEENIKALGTFLVEDVEITAQRKRELLAQIPPVFDLDEEAAAKAHERLRQALEFLRRNYQELSQQKAAGEKPNAKNKTAHPRFPAIYKVLLEKKPEFDRILGVTIPNSTFHLLARSELSPQLEDLINQVLAQFFRQGVISSRSMLTPEPTEILVRRLPSRKEVLEHPPFAFVDLEDTRKPVAKYCREVAADFSSTDRWLVCDLAQYLLVPNVSPNFAETQERQIARLKELQPAYFQVKRGEMLVREGERLTPLHLAKLQAQSRVYPQSRRVLLFLGIFLSLNLLLVVTYQVGRASLKHFPRQLRDLAFLSVLVLSSLLLSKAFLILGEAVTRISPEVGQNLIYFLPLGLAPIFTAIFLGLETGVGMALLCATLTAFLLEKPFPFFIYMVSAGLVGVWGVKNYRHRSALIKAGLAISLVNLAMVSVFKLMEFPFTAQDLFIGQAFALGGGLLTGVLALGLTPIIEAGFHYTSNIRLLEVLNLDQPILRELMLLAPGTYHHSLVVGQMVEAAAEAIGANPLVAKAAAYYHDIGKVKKPPYFVENQLGGENKHEKLAPSMSALILISHVKDGVDLARKHKLGDRIVDIIQQHHGSSFISYFFHKAKTQAGQTQQVNPEDYRYPGPRPQTREAGLVLLADQVEAASKTLTDPTPARIQGMVQKIINNVFADGQLDNCELTLKDLHLIAKSFNKILSGIFHQRIHYPLPVEKKKSNDDLDKQPAKKSSNKSGENQEKSREDLKRLGLE